MADAAAFNQALKDFVVQDVPQLVSQVQRKICLDALTKLVMKTPVRTGRARGNWQVGINQQPKGEAVGAVQAVSGSMGAAFQIAGRFDPDGRATIAEGEGTIKMMPPFVVCYITNNVSYILKLEDGGSKQAPQGMLAVTFDELIAGLQ